MRRLVQTLGCAAALSLTASTVAHAATFINNQPYCGGNTFSTCASITASTTTDGSGNTVLVLIVTNGNAAGSGSTFTSIGVGNLGGVSLVGTPTDNSANFTFSSSPEGLIGAGIASDVIGFNSSAPVSQNGLLPGQSITLSFTFSGPLDTSNLQFAIHDQGGAPADCEASTKLVVTGSAGVYGANTGTCGGTPPTTVTPEPASMVLLGTGLLGFGGIAVRRRKNVA